MGFDKPYQEKNGRKIVVNSEFAVVSIPVETAN
jgi:hypothetical protein